MKRGWILPTGFLILLVILVGTQTLLPVAAETIIGSANFVPDYIFDLSMPPNVVDGTVRFPSGKGPTVQDIDPATVMLEGSLPPQSTNLVPGGLVSTFDGEMVANIIWAKVYHMQNLPPSNKVYLTITGNLVQSLGATPFSATGYIKIGVHHSPPPP